MDEWMNDGWISLWFVACWIRFKIDNDYVPSIYLQSAEVDILFFPLSFVFACTQPQLSPLEFDSPITQHLTHHS